MGNSRINGKTTTLVEMPGDQRLVGHEVIAKIVSELHDRMFSDSHTWYHWKGRNTDDRAKECRQFTSLVWGSLGGPVISQVPNTGAAITPLGVGKVEWQYFVNMAGETLDQSPLTDGEKDQVFSLLTRAKATITVDSQAQPSVGVFAVFPHSLTQREREVLRHLAMGKNNPEIARELFISINTVTRHITNIFTKTSTSNRVQAAVYAARRHLV